MRRNWHFFINPNRKESQTPWVWGFSEIDEVNAWGIITAIPHRKTDTLEKFVSLHPLNKNISRENMKSKIVDKRDKGYNMEVVQLLPCPYGDDLYFLMVNIVATFLQAGAEKMKDGIAFNPDKLLIDITNAICVEALRKMDSADKLNTDPDLYMFHLSKIKTDLFSNLLFFGSKHYQFNGYLESMSSTLLQADEIIKSFIFKEGVISPIW